MNEIPIVPPRPTSDALDAALGRDRHSINFVFNSNYSRRFFEEPSEFAENIQLNQWNSNSNNKPSLENNNSTLISSKRSTRVSRSDSTPRSYGPSSPPPHPPPTRANSLNQLNRNNINQNLLAHSNSSSTINETPLSRSLNFQTALHSYPPQPAPLHYTPSRVQPPPLSPCHVHPQVDEDTLRTGAIPQAVALMRGNSDTARVRRNWYQNFALNFEQISRGSKLILFLNLALTLSQLASGSIILAITWNSSCDQPLRIYIIVSLIRNIVVFPLKTYEHLKPGNSNIFDSTDGRSSTYPTPTESPSTILSQIAPWLNHIKAIFDVFGFVWFCIGNYFLFKSQFCSLPLYYLTFILVIVGYFILLIPIFLCGAVIFCLPCVLVGMRWLRVEAANHDPLGVSQEEIRKLKTLKYRKKGATTIPTSISTTIQSSGTTLTEGSSTDKSVTTQTTVLYSPAALAFFEGAPPILSPIQTPVKSPWLEDEGFSPGSIIRRMPLTPALAMTVGSDLEEIELDDDDAVCVICLNQYMDNEQLTSLPCSHHFHGKCVNEWLRMNKTCPLCVRDVISTSMSV